MVTDKSEKTETVTLDRSIQFMLMELLISYALHENGSPNPDHIGIPHELLNSRFISLYIEYYYIYFICSFISICNIVWKFMVT